MWLISVSYTHLGIALLCILCVTACGLKSRQTTTESSSETGYSPVTTDTAATMVPCYAKMCIRDRSYSALDDAPGLDNADDACHGYTTDTDALGVLPSGAAVYL